MNSHAAAWLCWLLLPLGMPGAFAAGSGFAGRSEVREFIAEMHEKHGFEPARLSRLFRQINPQPGVIRAILPPHNPSVRSWVAYRDRYVEPIRINGGLRFWDTHRNTLDAARRRYGVPEEIIVAIIGIETRYGRDLGRFSALAALATLAFDYPPRAALFRGELEALLLLSRDMRRDPLGYRGSYAGAIGLPQFLPSSIRNWAVDFDDDGQIDLTGSAADAIGSVARFLSDHGWVVDGPILEPATVSGEDTAELIEAGIAPWLTPAEMAARGVHSAADAPQLPCALIDLASADGPVEYRLGFRNFYVLTRYNRSSLYATAVFELARELRRRQAGAAAIPD